MCRMFIISQVVDKTTDEAQIITQYVKNTHAATHNTYTLEVQEVSHIVQQRFKITTSSFQYHVANAQFLKIFVNNYSLCHKLYVSTFVARHDLLSPFVS